MALLPSSTFPAGRGELAAPGEAAPGDTAMLLVWSENTDTGLAVGDVCETGPWGSCRLTEPVLSSFDELVVNCEVLPRPSDDLSLRAALLLAPELLAGERALASAICCW